MNSSLENHSCEICIIGGGPAGLSAGVYCGRGNIDTIILEGNEIGALERAKEVSNWLGEYKVSGKDLLKKFKHHTSNIENIKILEEDAISLTLDLEEKIISTRSSTITAKCVIIATGKGEREELIKGETELIGRGVSYCALCDGALYKNRDVYLYGDNNEVLEDALVLDQMGCNVNIITQKSIEELPPQKDDVLSKQIKIFDKLEVNKVESNEMGNLKKIYCSSSNKEREFDSDALFIFTHNPSDSLFKDANLKLNDKGYLIVNNKQESNIEGVFACGDVTGGILQIVFAVSEGARAGINATKYIRHNRLN